MVEPQDHYQGQVGHPRAETLCRALIGKRLNVRLRVTRDSPGMVRALELSTHFSAHSACTPHVPWVCAGASTPTTTSHPLQ